MEKNKNVIIQNIIHLSIIHSFILSLISIGLIRIELNGIDLIEEMDYNILYYYKYLFGCLNIGGARLFLLQEIYSPRNLR